MVGEGGDEVRTECVCQDPVDRGMALWKGCGGLEGAWLQWSTRSEAQGAWVFKGPSLATGE